MKLFDIAEYKTEKEVKFVQNELESILHKFKKLDPYTVFLGFMIVLRIMGSILFEKNNRKLFFKKTDEMIAILAKNKNESKK